MTVKTFNMRFNIVRKWLKKVLSDQLDEPQSGFRKGEDHRFTLKQLIENKTSFRK